MSFQSRSTIFASTEVATPGTSRASLLGRLLVTISVTRAVWRERTLMRRSLAQMDTRSLREAGLCPAAAAYEAGKPFWRPVGSLR